MLGTGFTEFIAAFATSVTSRAMLLAAGNLAITALVMSLISGWFGFSSAKAEQGFVGRITTSAVGIAVFSTIAVNLLLTLVTAAFHFE
jgi:ABC-type transporter Mla maintaining outer membrane lipid asymmetry permease subunit MlaE